MIRVARRSSEVPASPALPAGDAAVLEARGLELRLSRDGEQLPVLRGIDLSVGRGEILGLAGESGSGKSVFGLSALGLLPREAEPELGGSLLVGGLEMTDPDADPEAVRRLRRHGLGAVFQDPMTSLDPTMRVGRQLLEVVASEAEAVELLSAVGVPDPARRLRAYPHELSGGLRQRTMIAMAVAGEPRLLVADEPTTALDVTVQAQILALLERLRDELSCSIVLITHDLGVASQIADRIAVMYGGRIAEVAPTAQLLDSPRHPYTAALLESRLDLETDREARLRTLAGEPPGPRRLPPGCPFAPRCRHARAECGAELPPLRGAGAQRDACLRSEELGVLASDEVGEAWGEVVRDPAAPPALVAQALRVDVPQAWRLRKPPPVRILDGVDLTVAAGEAVAIVGESGSGKTTFVRAAAGLMPVSAGRLDLADEAPQMVFQDAGASLTPWLSVGEQIGDRLRSASLDREQRRRRVEEAMAMAGLSPALIGARPGQLSGGQRQRAAIARAIVEPPRLLLCDEPTSALDVSVAAAALNLLGDLRRRLGMALVFVTHDLAVARLVADRIAVMYLGRIVEIGPAATLMSEAVHPYTRTLLASIPAPQARRAPLPGEPPSLFAPPSGCAFHPRCAAARESCAAREPRPVETAGGHLVDCVLVEEGG